jgi:hypothetical protein
MTVIDYKLKQNIDTLTDSAFENPFKDKWVSIIGDSISTFKGWCDSNDNANDYYSENNANNSDVKSVEDTWWHILLTKLGAKLCVNCSIGGSKIYDDTNSLLDRVNNKDYCRQVGKTYRNLNGSTEVCESEVIPDYVIIFMGTNDWRSNNDSGIFYKDETLTVNNTESTFKVRVPFSLYNWNKYEYNSTWKNSSILGIYHQVLASLSTLKATSGNYLRIITFPPNYGKGLWKQSTTGNEGIDDLVNTMKEISYCWHQPVIDSHNWFRTYSTEYQDGTGFHPMKKMMEILADGMYKNMMILPY